MLNLLGNSEDRFSHDRTHLVSCLSFQPVSATDSAQAISSPSSSKDFKDFEDELNANREIVSFLQIQLDELTKELESRFVLTPYTCFEPRPKEPVFGVFQQVQHKQGCTATEDSWRLEISD